MPTRQLRNTAGGEKHRREGASPKDKGLIHAAGEDLDFVTADVTSVATGLAIPTMPGRAREPVNQNVMNQLPQGVFKMAVSQ